MNKQEHEALRLCVESLDQLLPYLAKVPADVGLLNDALMAARPLLKQEPARERDERVSFDDVRGTVTIFGAVYAQELLQDLGQALPVGELFRLVDRNDGALTIERVRHAITEQAPAQDEQPFTFVCILDGKIQRQGSESYCQEWADAWNASPSCVENLGRATVEPLDRRPAQTEQRPNAWQSIILHASELADMVLKGDAPQTAQRTARVLLSMLAAPIAQTDPWQPSGADYDRAIHGNPDAKAWADLFVETFPGLADKRDLMIGWFANAMMAMHDHLARKTAPQPWQSGLVEALEEIAAGEKTVWRDDHFEVENDMAIDYPGIAKAALDAYRAALSAPGAGKFRMGDRVKKTSGSEWVGHVCGTYSTALTPEGYAVESEAHAGSVQIYPAKALEAVE